MYSSKKIFSFHSQAKWWKELDQTCHHKIMSEGFMWPFHTIYSCQLGGSTLTKGTEFFWQLLNLKLLICLQMVTFSSWGLNLVEILLNLLYIMWSYVAQLRATETMLV